MPVEGVKECTDHKVSVRDLLAVMRRDAHSPLGRDVKLVFEDELDPFGACAAFDVLAELVRVGVVDEPFLAVDNRDFLAL